MPGSATRACSSDPTAERTSRPSVPPWRSSSQRSGQSVSICSVDGDSVTTWSSPAPQRLVGGQRRSCRTTGPGRRRGRLPRPAAPIALQHKPAPSSSTASVGCADHRAQPADHGAAEPAPAARGSARRARSRASVASAASSSQNGDGSIDSSPLSLSTAVTSRRRRARPIAAISSLRSSASSGALLEIPRSTSVATPSITSTSC